MLVPSSLMQSMASFVSQNVGAGQEKRAKQAMFTGIGIGLSIGCLVFILVFFKGNILTGLFTTNAIVVQKGYAYLKGFAPKTIVTAILFSMVGYFNGHDKTVWVMIQGLIDFTGASSPGLCDEYSTACQLDQDWFSSTHCHYGWNCFKCSFLSFYESQEE